MRRRVRRVCVASKRGCRRKKKMSVGAFQDGSTMNYTVSLPPTDVTDDVIKKRKRNKKKHAQTV